MNRKQQLRALANEWKERSDTLFNLSEQARKPESKLRLGAIANAYKTLAAEVETHLDRWDRNEHRAKTHTI